MKAKLLYPILFGSVLTLTACGGSDNSIDLSKFDITSPIDSTIDLVLEGTFKGVDDLKVEFKDNQAILTDFGTSIFKTHQNLVPIGSPLINDIRCYDESTCNGFIAVPQGRGDVPTSVLWEVVTLTKKGDNIAVKSASWGEWQFTPKAIVEGNENTGNITALKHDAGCEAWLTALTKLGTLRATWKAGGAGGHSADIDDYGDLTLRYFVENGYKVESIHTRTLRPGEAPITEKWINTVNFDDNFGGQGYCRIYAGPYGAPGWGYPLFPHTLFESGEVTFISNPYRVDGGYIDWKFKPN